MGFVLVVALTDYFPGARSPDWIKRTRKKEREEEIANEKRNYEHISIWNCNKRTLLLLFLFTHRHTRPASGDSSTRRN